MPRTTKGTYNKRACDACHRRKTRCVDSPTTLDCAPCLAYGLTCTYTAALRVKYVAGKVLSTLRQEQKPSIAPYTRIGRDEASMIPWPCNNFRGSPCTKLILSCVRYFSRHIFSDQPILSPEAINQAMYSSANDTESCCLIWSLCGYALLHSATSMALTSCRCFRKPETNNENSAEDFLKDCLLLRESHDYVESPKVSAIVTSLLLYMSFRCLGKHPSAFLHFREAAMLSHIIGMHEEQYYLAIADEVESLRHRRLYWLLFVAERGYLAERQISPTLSRTISLPVACGHMIESTTATSFVRLVNLARTFDGALLNALDDAFTEPLTGIFCSLHEQLLIALPTYLGTGDYLVVSIETTTVWLRRMVHFTAVCQSLFQVWLLKSRVKPQYLTEARGTLASVEAAFLGHLRDRSAYCLVEDLFEVLHALADIMSDVPGEHVLLEPEPRDYLYTLVAFVSDIRDRCQRVFRTGPLSLEQFFSVLEIDVRGEQIDSQVQHQFATAQTGPQQEQ